MIRRQPLDLPGTRKRRAWVYRFPALLVAAVLLPAAAEAQLFSRVYVSGLNQPLAFIQDPSDPTVQYIVEKPGRIKVVKNGVLRSQLFLDLTTFINDDGERGLLGLAFPPDYGSSRRFYVNFTNNDGHTVVARFKRNIQNPLVADGGSRFDLRWPGGLRVINQPASNHNGGNIAFGPDGHLYIGMGDGGGSVAPPNSDRSQDPNTLLGKMLRIDVDVADDDPDGYVVPNDNPFVDGDPVPSALHEIWAFGLRNPWRWSFDMPSLGGTGALLIGDVGQNTWEEIDYQPAGRGGDNYGWSGREGAHDFHAHTPEYTPLTEPIIEYSHARRRLGDRRLRLSRRPARRELLRAVFLRRLEWSSLVGGAQSTLGTSVEQPRTHRGAGRNVDAREHQLIRDRCQRRVVCRQHLEGHRFPDPEPLTTLGSRSTCHRTDRAGPSLSISVGGQWIWDGVGRGHRRGRDSRAGLPGGRGPRHVDPSHLRPCTARCRRDLRQPVHELGLWLMVTGLQPGQYQLVVSMHSTVTNTFNRSKTVNVNITGPSPNPSFRLTGRRTAPPWRSRS